MARSCIWQLLINQAVAVDAQALGLLADMSHLLQAPGQVAAAKVGIGLLTVN